MTITPLELLDTSMAQLQTLVAFLDDQLDGAESAALETHACQEIARSLYLLIRTVRESRSRTASVGDPSMRNESEKQRTWV